MKGIIKEFAGNSIHFLEDGVEEIQVLELAAHIKPSYVGLGRTDLTVKENEVTFVAMENKQIKGIDKGTDKESWADDMTSFEDLLTVAHKKFPGKLEIRTEIVRDGDGKPLLNVKDKFCVVKATVVVDRGTKDEQLFEAHGDATNDNISGAKIKPHFIRMAETRAISRALRWATNNATVAAEETVEGKLPEAKKSKKKGEGNAKPQ